MLFFRFILSNYCEKKLKFLQDCCVSEEMISQVTAALEQVLTESSWMDLSFSLPSQLSNDDVIQLLDLSMKENESFRKEISVLCDTIVCSNKFVEQCEKLFHAQVLLR